MMKKVIGVAGILAIGTLCFASNAFAVRSNEVQSRHIAEADGTSGQDTNSGEGVKTGHIQDGAVTDAKISDVSMGKVTGLDAALDGKVDNSHLQSVVVAIEDEMLGNYTNVMGEINTLGATVEIKADQAYVDVALDNPVLPVKSTAPYTCNGTAAGAIVLTARYSTCVCNGTDWVSAADGITGCEWFGIVISADGRVWMDRNLGAARVATSSIDAAAYGDLYQWGRGADGHQVRTSGQTSTLSATDDPGHGDFILVGDGNSSIDWDWRNPQNDDLWQGATGINNPCPAGFRLPTETELTAEKNSWSSQDGPGAIASPLKLPMGGYRWEYNGSIIRDQTLGYYWSSTVAGGKSVSMYFVPSQNYPMTLYPTNRSYGFSVRCIQD